MSGWSNHSGLAVSLPHNNVDTDQIIPARFMSQPRVDGYQDFLFHDVRRDDKGQLDAAFPLNRFSNASLLICGNNFGCGSSREAAAYALFDAGIRVVVATGFGDIFAANSVNNGLLPALLKQQDKEKLDTLVGDGAVECKVDLETKTISTGLHQFEFKIDESWRTKLINGWDDIDLTLQFNSQISAFKNTRKQNSSWAWPAKP